jgi:predicted permease
MDILSDSKRALRRVLAQRGLTAVVVATLAAGIGENATVWSWMEALVRRPLPGVARQEELAVLVSNQGGGNVSQLDFRDFADLDRVFAGALMTQMTFASLEVDDRPEWVNTEIVSAGFFDVLGAQARLGRFFRPDEDRTPGGDAVLVISERLWRRRFGADPAVIGRAVELNRHAFTIVGVAAAPFRGSMSAMAFDVWAPSSMIWEVRNQRLEGRAARGWHNLFRRRPGVSVAQAAAAAETLNAQLAMAYPETNRGTRHRLVAMPDCPTGAQAVMGPVLRLLQAVSLGVLLIVAVNVASLSLAGAAGRRKELAIQLALGASRGRLVRGLMLESLVRAVLGGALGLVLATQLTSAISVFLPAAPAGVELDTPIDSSTLVFTLLLTIATGLTIGLVTAIAATRIPLEESLKAGGRSSSAAGPPRLRNALVAAEVALSLVLLVGAGLCLQGLRRARTVDLGLDPDHVLTARLQIGMNGYTPQTGLGFYRELRRRLAATAGVEEAALASWFPLGLSGCKGSGVYVDGYEAPPGEDTTYEFAIVSARYFAALRIPVLAGREFGEQDDLRAERVAVVNQAFAERFWPGQDPLGRRFRTRGEWRTIVGLTPTGRYNLLDEAARPFYWLPDQQGVPELDLAVAVRTKGDPEAIAAALRGAVQGLDPGVDLLGTLSLRRHVERVFFPQRMASDLLLLLGAVSLGLAGLGVYGVMAHVVAQRTREFGVRAALGATRRDVLWLVLRQSLVLSVAGIAAGLVLSLGLTRLVSGFLHGVSPFDPLTYTAVPAFLALVGLVASGLPARRATQVEPVVALRCE